MAQLDTSVNLVNISAARSAAAPIPTTSCATGSTQHLFHGATFGDLIARRRPITMINATDIYNRTPFLFSPPSFAAACSDITQYPFAAGVAASAAVPAAFAPVVIETFPEQMSDTVAGLDYRGGGQPGCRRRCCTPMPRA